jgi:hypothetical protein
MITRQNFLIVISCALVAWGGAGLNTRLGLRGTDGLNLAIFAIGIVMIAQVPYLALSGRLARIESSLARRTDSTTKQ